MVKVINKLLEKRGLKPEELNPEEQETLDAWRKTLSKGEITIETIAEFCDFQIRDIEGQFKNLENSGAKIEKLVLLHNVYSAIKGLIVAPKHEKEALEKYLTSL